MTASDNQRSQVASDPPTPATGDVAGGQHRVRPWVNWVLALLTVPAAALVMIFGIGGVMSTAACSEAECPDLGPSGVGFGVLFYGAAVVAAVTILASFFTARHRRGIIVPLAGWGLLIADFVVLAVTFGR